MADNEDHFGSSSSDSVVVPNPESRWAQQQSLPGWRLKNEVIPLTEGQHGRDEGLSADGGEDSKRKSSNPSEDVDDEGGLELSLGLSLGGSISKAKPKNGLKEVGGVGGDQRVGEKRNDDTSSNSSYGKEQKGITRRSSEGSPYRTQAFWQEFGVSRDGQQEEKLKGSDAHVHERHTQSTHSSPISSLSSLSSSVPSRPSLNVGLPDTWRSAENSGVEEPKAVLAHQFWQSIQEKASQAVQAKVGDESPLFTDLSGPPTHGVDGGASWACFGQGGVAMPLLDGFREVGEGLSRSSFPPSGKNNVMQTISTSTNTAGQLGGDGMQQQQLLGTESSPKDESIMTASEQRHGLDAVEQQKKQRKQEARKKRKAVMEEQKLQKKAKKEDEGREIPGPILKQGSRPDTPPLVSKVSSIALPREASPPDNQEAVSANPVFRRPTNGLWSRGPVWEALVPEKPQEKGSILDQNDEGKQLLEIRQALQRERDRAAKDKGWEVEMESDSEPRPGDSERRSPADGGFRQTYKGEETLRSQSGGSHNSSSHEASVAVSLPVGSGADSHKVTSHSGYQMSGVLPENKEMVPKGLPDLNGIQKRGCDNAQSSSERDRPFVSASLEQPDNNEERSRFDMRVGEAPPIKPEAGNRPSAVLIAGSNPASGPIITMGAYPHSSPFPLVHVPYPFPIPVASANGMPFPMPFPFPYVMQFGSSADSSGQERTGTLPLPTSFQVPPNFPQYPVPADVPPNWSPVLRPQATPPHSPPRSLARSSSGMPDEDVRSFQGSRRGEDVKRASPVKDNPTPSAGNPVLRASPLGSVQAQSGAFSRLRTSLSVPASPPPTPQFGPIRTRSGEVFLYQDGASVTSNTAFASLVAAVEASQGLSAAIASVSSASNKQPLIQRAGSGVKLERTSSRDIVSDGMEETSIVTSTSKVSSHQGEPSQVESISRTSNNNEGEVQFSHGNAFQQGTTQSIPLSEGLINQVGQEASSLKPGIAAGQMFGGSGSSPDLPWVTCTGAGPNGKTISGVLYRYNKGQVRIVCACHGRHMTPSEFVQHAGNVDLSNPEKNIVVGPFTLGTQAASAQG